MCLKIKHIEHLSQSKSFCLSVYPTPLDTNDSRSTSNCLDQNNSGAVTTTAHKAQAQARRCCLSLCGSMAPSPVPRWTVLLCAHDGPRHNDARTVVTTHARKLVAIECPRLQLQLVAMCDRVRIARPSRTPTPAFFHTGVKSGRGARMPTWQRRFVAPRTGRGARRGYFGSI